MRKNIIDTLNRATAEEVRCGKSWYSVARQECWDMSGDTGLHARDIAGIVSALSPRNRWDKNLLDASAIIHADNPERVRVSTFGANKSKAITILNQTTEENPEDILGGKKVVSFYRNICDPMDEEPITVDGHAFCIAKGSREVGVRITPTAYDKVADAYRHVARNVGLVGNQVQAITWLTYRREHGIT